MREFSVCEQLRLEPGDLIQAGEEVYIIARGCLAHVAEGESTVYTIQEEYNVGFKSISASDFWRIPRGAVVPDWHTNRAGLD
jgi:hypothetical protein